MKHERAQQVTKIHSRERTINDTKTSQGAMEGKETVNKREHEAQEDLTRRSGEGNITR